MGKSDDHLGHLYNLIYSYSLFRYVAEVMRVEEAAWEREYKDPIDPGGDEPLDGPWWEKHTKVLGHYVNKEEQENPS